MVLVTGVNRSVIGAGFLVWYFTFKVGSEGPKGIWTRT
jgi:nitrate reductase NapE component